MSSHLTKQKTTVKRVFVTGATGFIGSALVRHLSEQNIRIRCMVYQSPLKTQSSKIEQIQSSLEDFDWHELESYQPDVIYHFARMSGRTQTERRKAATANARANKQLIQWMKSREDPPLMIFGSGTLVYGDHGKEWVDELTSIKPYSFQREYFEAERPILQAMHSMHLPVIIVRPPWIYGPGSWFEWFFIKPMREQQIIPQYGSGKNYMSLIHLNDCAGLIHQIAKSGKPGECYNINAHAPIRQRQFTILLQELTGMPIKKYSRLRMWLQLERAAREALTFSLKSTTLHKNLFQNYPLRYPGLPSGLYAILEELDII